VVLCLWCACRVMGGRGVGRVGAEGWGRWMAACHGAASDFFNKELGVPVAQPQQTATHLHKPTPSLPTHYRASGPRRAHLDRRGAAVAPLCSRTHTHSCSAMIVLPALQWHNISH
jgi:hypothetical protein